MTRSVEELRRETERSRTELAATVDRLKEQLSDTADDIRHKVSPQHIRSEVSGYIGQKAQGWLGALKQQAMDNPMQAIAAGTAIAVPALRLARGFPLPLLMIGAGLALTSKTVRSRAAEAAAPLMESAEDILETTSERVRSSLSNPASSAEQATGLLDDAKNKASGYVDDLRMRAAQATGSVSNTLQDGIATAEDKIDRVRSSAGDTVGAARDTLAAAPVRARQIVGDNAALVGGLGVAIGAIIAAALPKTVAEVKVMGGAHDSVKQTAMDATRSGFEAVKERTMSAVDAAAKRVAEAELGAHGSRMTQNMADTLKEAAEDVVTAAFNSDPKPNH